MLPATVEYYHKHGPSKDGLKPKCKACRCAWQSKTYYPTTRNKRIEYSKKYYNDNKTKISVKQHERYKDNPLPALQRAKKYSLTKKGKEVHRKATIKYSKSTHGKAVSRKCRHNRRTTIKKYPPIKARDIEVLIKQSKGVCWWCCAPCADTFHLDHRVPLSRGGANTIENIVVSCPSCNLRKNNRLPYEFNGRLL